LYILTKIAFVHLRILSTFSVYRISKKKASTFWEMRKNSPQQRGLRATSSGGVDTSMIVRTKDFDKPVVQLKKGGYKMKPGLVYLGFSTDFLIEEADQWRGACWSMIKERSDCSFLFLTEKVWYKSPLNTDKG